MSSAQRLLLIGSNGMLAQKVIAQAGETYEVIGVDLPEINLTDALQVRSLVERIKPHVIINCAAYTNVDGCETEEELATRVNGTALEHLAESAENVGATLVQISTDYVFSGSGSTPLNEEDSVGPQSAYGRSKLAGEEAILKSGLRKFFILRTSWLYGPGGNNFVETIIRLAKEREELGIIADQVGTPTYTGDLAEAIFVLLDHARKADVENHIFGLYHFSNCGLCSWYDFAVEIVALAKAEGANLKVKKVNPIATEDYPLPAKRPVYSVLSKQKYRQVTGKRVTVWQESLKKYLKERHD